MSTSCIVLSLIGGKPEAGVVENHASYARRHGYRHVIFDFSYSIHNIFKCHLKWAQIYDVISDHPDHAVLCLSERAVIYSEEMRVQDVFAGVPYWLSAKVMRAEQANAKMVYLSGGVDSANLILGMKAKLFEINSQYGVGGRALTGLIEASAAASVFRLDLANTSRESGVYPVMEFFWLRPDGIVDLNWGHENIPRVFVMSFDAPDGSNPDELLLISDPRPIKVILEDIRRGKYTVPESVEAAQLALDGFSPGECHINPAAPIAIVSLYTQGIAGYAEIHRKSLTEFCYRRGLAYHLYCGVPEFLPTGVNSNWAKAHVLLKHIEDHEWVFWVDADVVVKNMNFPVEDFISGRDQVVAFDHTIFEFNSGVMGYRATAENRELLRDVASRIEGLSDKKDVYAHGGDQRQFCDAFNQRNLMNARSVVSSKLVEHIPLRANPDAWFFHCPNMSSIMRRNWMQKIYLESIS